MGGSRGFTRSIATAQKAKTVEVDGLEDAGAEEEASEHLVCAETSIITLDTLELLVEVVSMSAIVVYVFLDVCLNVDCV